MLINSENTMTPETKKRMHTLSLPMYENYTLRVLVLLLQGVGIVLPKHVLYHVFSYGPHHHDQFMACLSRLPPFLRYKCFFDDDTNMHTFTRVHSSVVIIDADGYVEYSEDTVACCACTKFGIAGSVSKILTGTHNDVLRKKNAIKSLVNKCLFEVRQKGFEQTYICVEFYTNREHVFTDCYLYKTSQLPQYRRKRVIMEFDESFLTFMDDL